MVDIRIRAFGTLAIAIDGRTVQVPSGKPEQLLRVLIGSSGSIMVESLLDTLWPEDSLVERTRLNNVIARLRRVVPEGIERSRERVSLDTLVYVDSIEFESLSLTSLNTSLDQEARVLAARRAISLYLAPFMSDCLYIDAIRDHREFLAQLTVPWVG